jgi:hypothetical protein
MLGQLPPKTIDVIFSSYLHKNFISRYQIVFLVGKDVNLIDTFKGRKMPIPSYFTWDDQAYREFMLLCLQSLETRFVPAKMVILDEFEESNEVNFLIDGSIVIGYEINKIKKYCLKLKNRCIIGAYGVTFSVRSEFCYTSLVDSSMLFIRKLNWLTLLRDNPDITKALIGKILFDYNTAIKTRVNKMKRKAT